MEIKVMRSPASVSWWVTVNGRFLLAFDREYEAQTYADKLQREYGVC